jgi:Fe-S-cluster-containing hydrogenase component 2
VGEPDKGTGAVHSRRRFLFGGGGGSRVEVEEGARKARVEPRCMAVQGVVCRTCEEHCEPGAIRFKLLPAGRSIPLINDARCNACGDCVRVCPAQAMALRVVAAEAAA